MIEVRVGSGAKVTSFYGHKRLIAPRSHFFRKALAQHDLNRCHGREEGAPLISEDGDDVMALSEDEDDDEHDALLESQH
jgi:hypothetical protein